MAYPDSETKSYKKNRNLFASLLFSFSLGALSNLAPFLDYLDITKITIFQWVFLILDVVLLFLAVVVSIVYTIKIRRVRKRIESKKPGGV